MDFYYPSAVLEQRYERMRRWRIALGIMVGVLIVLGSGIAETSRIQTMELTSAEATMKAMGVWQQ